jgi:hypothetical protein
VYAALWRALPGPTWAKAAQAAVLLAVVVAVCFRWVFPVLEPLMPFADVTVGP